MRQRGKEDREGRRRKKEREKKVSKLMKTYAADFDTLSRAPSRPRASLGLENPARLLNFRRTEPPSCARLSCLCPVNDREVEVGVPSCTLPMGSKL